MAFDTTNNKANRLAPDGIVQVDDGTGEDNGTELTNLVQQTMDSNVIATQSWVSRILRRFCWWTKVFHTDVLHVSTETHTPYLKSDTIECNDIYAKGLTLVGENGAMVRLSVGEDGRLKISDTFCDVFVYPTNNVFVREYLYRDHEKVAKNFTGLTEWQVLLNFVPFVNCRRVQHNGYTCQFLCRSDGEDDLVNHTLLFTMPPNKVAKDVVVVDEDGNEVKRFSLPEQDGIKQLTVNLPHFRDPNTGEIVNAPLPKVDPTWTGTDTTAVFPSPIPPLPPPSCSGFVPPPASGTLPEPTYPGDDIFNDDPDVDYGQLDPDVDYEVLNEEYSTNTYYNIVLKRSDFPHAAKTLFLLVETTPGE